MYLLLRNHTGRIVEAALLAAGRNVIRVALRGRGDTLELRSSDDGWISGDDERFEIEALTAGTDHTMIELGGLLKPQALTAGMQASW
jgi:hypothetical protein